VAELKLASLSHSKKVYSFIVTEYGQNKKQIYIGDDVFKLFSPDAREVVLEFDGHRHFTFLPDSLFTKGRYLRTAYLKLSDKGKPGRNCLQSWLADEEAEIIKLQVVQYFKHFKLEVELGRKSYERLQKELIWLGKYVTIHPHISFGKPTFLGSRLYISAVLEELAMGRSIEEITRIWELKLPREAVIEVLHLAARAVNEYYRAKYNINEEELIGRIVEDASE